MLYGVLLLLGANMATKPTTDVEDVLITREEAARLLGIKPQTLASWAVKRWYDTTLPVIKINRMVRYRLSNVIAFRDAHQVEIA